MGVTGSFVFAAQMINFTIPATGASGHLAGGMLLAVLLGPHAGFLTMAAVLLIQALFFGDGGLLAYGCNVINLGFFPSYIAYPLIYQTMIRKGLDARSLLRAALVASILGLQLGSAGVVLETALSGRTELPFTAFLLLMQPIHLAIGIVEGLVTAAILRFLWQARPDLLLTEPLGRSGNQVNEGQKKSLRGILLGILVVSLILGGIVSWYASTNPDGLEWSIQKLTGATELQEAETYDGIDGILGGLLTLVLVTVTGGLVRLRKRRKDQDA